MPRDARNQLASPGCLTGVGTPGIVPLAASINQAVSKAYYGGGVDTNLFGHVVNAAPPRLVQFALKLAF